MSLRQLVRANDWNALEEAWTEIILAEGPIDGIRDALMEVGKRKEMPRCVHLVREHADSLMTLGRNADAAELLGIALLKGGNPGELTTPLLTAAQAAWSAESWWPTFADLVGFHEGTDDIRSAWRGMSRLLSLQAGGAVYHASGWGVGAIEEVDLDNSLVDIRFVSGRRDKIPLASALQIFEILEPGDMRSMLAADPAGLKKTLSKEPLVVLRDVVRRYENRVHYPQLRTALSQLGVDGAAFTTWWRKARKQAETSEWFEITGTATKAVVRLLTDAADPVESMRRQLQRSRSLTEAMRRVRDLLSGSTLSDEMRAVALETLDGLADDEAAPTAARLSTWLLLRDARGETPPPLASRMRAAADQPPPDNPAERPAIWSLIATLPSARDHESCIGLLPEIFGDSWQDIALRDIPHVPHGMARTLCDKLLEANRADELGAHYRTLLARPIRNPQALVILAERAERVETSGISGEFPSPTSRLESLVRLAGHLKTSAPGDTFLTRTKARLTQLLAGERKLLADLLEGADRTAIQAIHVLIERGVDGPIDNAFTNAVVRRMPDFFKSADAPFWEADQTWVTRRGLERREEELRVLKEVKIPENAEAIGKAASFGDLSENSEWEAAIEEQRTLTNRASELEIELRDVQLLEDAAVPENTACPGTEVLYREIDTGAEHRIQLVGPWDTEDFPHGISYRAPIGKGLLGLTPGEQIEVQLPTGEVRLEVLEVRPLPLEGREQLTN